VKFLGVLKDFKNKDEQKLRMEAHTLMMLLPYFVMWKNMLDFALFPNKRQ
jgi:hypothetical protein